MITFYSIILIHKRALRYRTRSSLSNFFKSIQQFGVSVEGIEKLKHLGWDFLIVSAILIVFLCASCGSETNKEPLAEVPQIIKSPILGNRTTIKEVSVPPKLSLIESPSLNENNLVSFGFRSSKAGTISYSGNCFGSTKNAIKGDHQHPICDNGGRKL